MKRTIKILSLILSLTLLLLSASACADPPDNLPDNGGMTTPPADNGGTTTDTEDPSDTDTEKDPTDTETEKDPPPEENSAILADLNGDGTNDTITITYDNEEKSSATIKVINGKDQAELWSDTLALGSHKIGAYYLKVGKSGEPNELVFWNYILREDQLVFAGSIFDFDMYGMIDYRKNESKMFDVGPQASIESGNIPFGVIIDMINENIMADCLQYSAYLLLDNQKDALALSTKDNMLTPTALTFTLENFTSGGNDTLPDTPEPPADKTEMAIEAGYTVISTKNLSIPVWEKGATVNHTARLAALRKDNGEQALYLDVLAQDNTVMASITWKGYYQLLLTDEGQLILFRIAASPASQRGTVVYQYYELSDTQISGYDVIELETPQINLIPGKGKSLNFTLSSPTASELHFTDLMYGYRYALEDAMDDGQKVYLIADSYLEPKNPVLYSDTEKTPAPDFENKAIADKYTLDYAMGLYE